MTPEKLRLWEELTVWFANQLSEPQTNPCGQAERLLKFFDERALRDGVGEAPTRAQIVGVVMALLKEEPVETPMERPSIAELERILNSEETHDIRIKPDGSVVELKPTVTTVGKLADAILALYPPAPRGPVAAQKEGT